MHKQTRSIGDDYSEQHRNSACWLQLRSQFWVNFSVQTQLRLQAALKAANLQSERSRSNRRPKGAYLLRF